MAISLGFLAQFKYDDRVKNKETQSADHEAAVIRAFVQRDKQERFLGFLASPKNRKKFTESLSHFRWFDQRFAVSLQWKVGWIGVGGVQLRSAWRSDANDQDHR